MKSRRRMWVVVVALVAAVGGGVIAMSSSRSPGKRTASSWAHGHEVPNALHEAANEGKEQHEAKFNRSRGGEARREGPTSPPAEQVGDRAYPRNY
ncbi:MAG: hypothetical protein JWM71_290, partial [Solirubrobacteraceae bacterium]|nr:hypothetical protein [Solirubrobacteraceae bacterium]